ncbi:MAG: HEAT repeat domain-containing protein, partial [Bdellovibrionota bacterium]
MNKLFFLVTLVTLQSSSVFAAAEATFSDLKKTIMSEKLHYSERWAATLKLVETDSPKVEKELVELADRKEWFIRNAALVGLQKVNPEKAYDLAKKLLKDQALVVRSAALQVITPVLKSVDRSILWTELAAKYNFRGKSSLWIRKDLVEALADSPMKSEYERFQGLMKDGDEEIRYQA